MKKSKKNDFTLTEAPLIFRQKLSFLIQDWGFVTVEAREENYGCYFRYKKDHLILRFAFDYRENSYYFDFQTEEGQDLGTMLHYFLQKAGTEEEKLNPDIFNPEKVGRMTALDNYLNYIKRYEEDLLKLA